MGFLDRISCCGVADNTHQTTSLKSSHSITLLVIGDSQVGKSTLVDTLEDHNKKKDRSYHKSSDFEYRQMHANGLNDKQQKFKIWEVSCQFSTMMYNRFKQQKGIRLITIFVFSLSDADSFESIVRLHNQESLAFKIPQNQGKRRSFNILLGNKNDENKQTRAVDNSQARIFADQNCMDYAEISAFSPNSLSNLLVSVLGDSQISEISKSFSSQTSERYRAKQFIIGEGEGNTIIEDMTKETQIYYGF